MTIKPMPSSKKCGAHSRTTGMPCTQWGMANGRCRMHGGRSTGPKSPSKGNWKHGARSKGEKDRRAAIRKLLAGSRQILTDLG